jgi:hypothetical protein
MPSLFVDFATIFSGSCTHGYKIQLHRCMFRISRLPVDRILIREEDGIYVSVTLQNRKAILFCHEIEQFTMKAVFAISPTNP